MSREKTAAHLGRPRNPLEHLSLLPLLASTYRLLRQTGLLSPFAPMALLQLGLSFLRHGVSLYSLAAWSARRFPERLALLEGERQLSFGELATSTHRLASVLAQTFPGARSVGLLGRNRIEYVEAVLACGRWGAETFLLNTMWGAEQLKAFLEARPVDLLFYDAEFHPAVTSIRQHSPRTHLICLDQTIEGTTDLAELRSVRASSPLPRRGSGRLTLLTSGTTGAAKLVRRKPSLGELLGLLTGLLSALQPRTGDPVLLTVPLLHGHGLTTLGLSLAMAVPLYLFPRGRAEDYLHCLERYPIRVLTVVPTILYRLLGAAPPGWQPRSLDRIICGSAPLPPELARRTLKRLGPVLFNLYGSSETGVISLATPRDLAEAPDCVGRPLPGVGLTILNPQHNPLKPGEIQIERGGIAVKTGDVGRLDAEGRLFLLGRRDEMLILGGENVYPQALEAQIQQALEYALECAVVGVPDPEYGQAVHLFVVLKEGRTLEAEQIAQDLEAALPRTLRPKRVTVLEALPKNLAGKVQRHRLAH
ncbi:MAG: AMP-binding protein [Meiothermus sp.]|nr:AMP-binding protein [Meiothermus sp.]